MKHKKKNNLWKLLPFLLVVLIYLLLPKDTADENTPPSEATDGSYSVHILDVGQGLSVLIQSGEDTLLFDGGVKDASSYVVSYLQEQGIRKLDYVIASHYDADHLAGIVSALNAFETEILLAPDYEADTYTYESFQQAVENHNLTVTYPEVNMRLSFGSGEICVLAPASSRYEDENDYSIVLRITLGDSSLLLTGDATTFSEEEMMTNHKTLDSDILVLGHHGSYSSTGQDFFEEVTPEYAIISCGLYNDYGYPHRRIMELLEENETAIYRTDLQGTIRFTMTAEDIVFETSPSKDYSTGDELRGSGTYQDDTENSGNTSSLLEELSAFPFVLNTYRMKFHLPTCESVLEMSTQNRQGSNLTRDELIEAGYTPCGSCRP